MKKIVLSLKDINIYNIISFKLLRLGTPPIGSPDGKSLKIDTISQNSLNAFEK